MIALAPITCPSMGCGAGESLRIAACNRSTVRDGDSVQYCVVCVRGCVRRCCWLYYGDGDGEGGGDGDSGDDDGDGEGDDEGDSGDGDGGSDGEGEKLRVRIWWWDR